MKESKMLKILPNQEAEVIGFWQRFGWELQSSQEVLHSDTHTEQSLSQKLMSYANDAEIYTEVHEKQHFIRLTLTRETSMNGYKELKELEEEYLNNAEKSKQLKQQNASAQPEKVSFPMGILGIVLCVMVPFIGWAILLITAIKYSSTKKAAEKTAEENNRKLAERKTEISKEINAMEKRNEQILKRASEIIAQA